MKQKQDRATLDIFTNKAGVGRPRRYVSNAQRQRAYRQRLKEAKKL